MDRVRTQENGSQLELDDERVSWNISVAVQCAPGSVSISDSVLMMVWKCLRGARINIKKKQKKKGVKEKKTSPHALITRLLPQHQYLTAGQRHMHLRGG